MAAVDSLIGLIELRKADGLVIEAGAVPRLMGGPGGGALTMPPLDPSLMAIFLDELLSPEENAAVSAGQVVECAYQSSANGSFIIKTRIESGRAKMTIRRGVLPRPAIASANVTHGPARSHAVAATTSPGTFQPTQPSLNAAAPATVTSLSNASTPPDTSLTHKPAVEAPDRPNLWAAPDPHLPAVSPLLRQLLAQAVAHDASDLFLSAGSPIAMKVLGNVVPLPGAPLTNNDISTLFEEWLLPVQRAQLTNSGSVDFGLQLESKGPRCRVNLFRQLNGLAAVLRPVRQRVPDLAQLALPRTLLRVVGVPSGLVVMTGPTGSGKSTTLAALLEHVNHTRACHVVTLEDPIEYQFLSDQALFHQREIGAHVADFSTGLRAALRESPDIIFVGEMRDPETIGLALMAAETGHLVLSTLHAGSAVGAIERMINAFSDSQRAAVRSQIAACLRFVITQHLVPGTDGKHIPVVEQLAVNHAVAAQIRDGRTHQLTTQMELGGEDGMVRLEASLVGLVRQGRISAKVALTVAPNRDALEAMLGAHPQKV